MSLQLRHASTIRKKLVKQQYLLHMYPQYGKHRFGSLGHPSKFQRVLCFAIVTAATSLIGGQPNFAQCLAVLWAGTLCIHFRRLLLPDGIFPGAKFTLRPSLAFSYIGSVTARHSSSGHQPNCGVVQEMELWNFRRGRHLYSAGRPSRWALANILVD